MSFPELLDAALGGTSEPRVLRDASLEGVRWLAGRPLEHPEPGAPLELAGPETQPEVSPAAAARLLDILDRRPDALQEWLSLVCERRLRIPPVQLPDVLEVGRFQDVRVRELIVEAGGAHMVWVAKLNPAWAFAAHARAEDQFTWGSREDRMVALRRIRRHDAAHARDLLETAWRLERGEVRASLLAALEPGLSLADEDLLVSALHDARREIREVALRLLRRLPESRWAARWTERAAASLHLSGSHLVVRIPAEIETSWQADGLDLRPPKGMADGAWIVQQVMALTPPRVWPTDLLDILLRDDRRVPLLAGLAQAAAAYADVQWCMTLIALSHPEVDARPLYLALPHARALDVLRLIIESGSLQKYHATLATLLREAAWHLDPRAVTLAEAWLDGQAVPLWFRPALVHLVDTLDYRLAMRRELDT